MARQIDLIFSSALMAKDHTRVSRCSGPISQTLITRSFNASHTSPFLGRYKKEKSISLQRTLLPEDCLMLTRRHNPHEIQVYLTGKSISERLKNVRRGDVMEEKKAFTETFRGAGWQAEAILESLQKADDF